MSKVLVLGSGAFGTAISNTLLNNKHIVNIYAIDKNQIEDLKKGYNSKFFPDFKLDSIPNLVTDNFKEAIEGVEFLFLAIPSKSIRDTLLKFKNDINKNIIIINAAKGIDGISKNNYLEVIRSILPNNQVATIAGPTFAIDLITKNYSASNVVSKNHETALKVIKLLQTDYFLLEESNDEVGVSLYSALKNVLAIGAGMLFGLNYSINTIAAFVNIGIDEINKYIHMKNGKEKTIFDYAGIGDIFLTCFSNKSRNYSFGELIAKVGIKEAIIQNTNTVEGINAILNIYEDIKNNDDFILFNVMYDLIENKVDPKDVIEVIWRKKELRNH